MPHTKIKNQESKIKNQRGVSILLAVLIMNIILAIGLGISLISLQQTKMMREVGYSVVAFYAADNGIEQELYDIFQSSSPQPHYDGFLDSASYDVTAKCSNINPEECPAGFDFDSDCDAENFCINSIGIYKGTRRAIKVKL